MYYVDTHAHLYSEFYLNIDQIINNAKEKNVLKIINCADSLATSIEILKLQNKYKGTIYPAIGIHPENVNTYKKTDIKQIEELLKTNKVYAIGEIGLDYYHDPTTKIEQQKLFKQLLSLAQSYNLPVIIHSRDANEDAINILKGYKLTGVFHSFSGTIEEARKIINMNFLIGINGISTFKNAKEIREIIRQIPLEKILLETDCPFLTPDPFRKEKNEPKFIPTISKNLAKILEKPEKKVMENTTKNALKLFDLDS